MASRPRIDFHPSAGRESCCPKDRPEGGPLADEPWPQTEAEPPPDLWPCRVGVSEPGHGFTGPSSEGYQGTRVTGASATVPGMNGPPTCSRLGVYTRLRSMAAVGTVT